MSMLLQITIVVLGLVAYGSAVYQILTSKYSPSFFSRGVWFLLGVNSFIGVYFGGGSKSAIILAALLFAGNTAIFIASYQKGSREFGLVEKISLVLLVVSGLVFLLLDAPFMGLVISLFAHFIGGIPTIWRVAKRPQSEQAYHWYFFWAASVLSLISSDKIGLKAVVFPLYFAFYDGLIIALVNRKRFLKN